MQNTMRNLTITDSNKTGSEILKYRTYMIPSHVYDVTQGQYFHSSLSVSHINYIKCPQRADVNKFSCVSVQGSIEMRPL